MDAMHDVARGDIDMMDGHNFNFTRRKKSIGGTVMTHQILFIKTAMQLQLQIIWISERVKTASHTEGFK